jgi:hypothetical protein
MLLNVQTVTGDLQIWRISTIGLNLDMQPKMQFEEVMEDCAG